MAEQTILEIKETLTGERKEFPCTACAVGQDEVVILYKLPHEGRVEDVVLPAGTLSLGYFWATRPYNAYHWVTPKGKTIGLYLNISEGAHITPQQVVWRDLVVDVLVTPDGRCRVLDEEELPAEMEVSLRQRINLIREELVRQHKALLAEIEVRSVRLLREVGLLGPPLPHPPRGGRVREGGVFSKNQETFYRSKPLPLGFEAQDNLLAIPFFLRLRSC